MAVTRLQRKVRKNRTRAAQRKAAMKRWLGTPVIRNVDKEKIKKREAPQKKRTAATSA